MDEVIAAVEAHVAAFNAKDVDAVVEGFADDAVFTAGEDLLVGRRALRAFFTDAFGAHVEARLELRRALVQGETAACELVETLASQGHALTFELAAFYTVREGRLARVRVYRDHSG